MVLSTELSPAAHHYFTGLKRAAEMGPVEPLITIVMAASPPTSLRSVCLQALLRLVVILQMATTPKSRALLLTLISRTLPAVPVVSLLCTVDPRLVFTFACEQQRRKE